ncbi:MAG TPA: malonate transporter subunit MadL [Cyclobacteriaceae bacterium]
MKIYGVAILAGCFLVGQIIGNTIGHWVNIPGNMGGVAFAMFLLILVNERARKKGLLKEETVAGIQFWNAMYIPVVVALSATQNVRAALTGGWVALVVGVVATGCCLLLVPLLSKIVVKGNNHDTTI